MSQDFIINMVFIAGAAILFMVVLLSGQQFQYCKANNLPHPFLKTKTGLHVVSNEDRRERFDIIQNSIDKSLNEVQLFATYDLLEDFHERFGRCKEYDQLLDQYISKQAMIIV